ncbi:MAG: ABC transporter substrate-binding protein [Beijerinckiaceae bacterium]
MSKLNLTLGCWDYDRVIALQNGTVQPDGIDLNFLNMEVEETFFRMVRHREFDVAEMSLSSYTVSLFRDPAPFIAIPVFPSRFFRHSCIFVSAKSGIKEPKDLIGKKIGVPEYQMTAPVWIRGILAEHYGVPVDSVTYYTGGEEEPGRPEKQGISLPPNIKVEAIPDDKTLSQMLKDGEIDALHSARSPSTLDGVHVKRLFPNYREVELEYYRKTKIFPTMHTIAIRRDVYEKNRWIAQSLFKAFCEAQQKTYHDLNQTAALKAMVPWLTHDIEEARREMGDDYWAYGLQPNYQVLEAFLRYHYEGGLSKRLLKPEELFAPETLEAFKI